MKLCSFAAAGLLVLASSCIAPSVLAPEERLVELDSEAVDWRPAVAYDVPGTYVSTQLSGPLAASLRKLVYHFEAEGAYTGAGLFDGDPPRFEVIGGHWTIATDGLHLDDAAPAALEVADDGSLRLTGEEGRVVLRKEKLR